MVMFHMMSDVTINLTTTTGSDAVNLNGATISLSNIHPTGTVLMGNGLVTATGTPGNVSPSLTYNSTNNTSKVENYGFVPQTLEDVTAGNDVVLTITTADNNRYIVDMKDVEFSASSFNSNLIANPYEIVESKCKINRWYPNFKYTYTFQLKKTGIETISATINDWENISAETQTVQIK
jgi:archaellin